MIYKKFNKLKKWRKKHIKKVKFKAKLNTGIN